MTTNPNINTGVNSFSTIKKAVSFIFDNSNTGEETTLNDCICFGMGVYAYKDECKRAGINVNNDSSAFHHLNEDELITLLIWLQDNDGYLYAA